MDRARRFVLAPLLVAATIPAQERPFHFEHDVLPWLARQGCAAADCHGGALGRGGFQLSLFGGDPQADHRAITVDRDGRRIDLLDPERSLLLRKPSGDLEHGGGRRLPRGSRAWRALRGWIAEGAPFTTGAVPRVEMLELSIEGDRLHAVAHYAWTDPDSGAPRRTSEDVADRAVFSTSAPDVVDVEPSGRLVHNGPGEAYLFARFAGRDARVRVVQPFAARSAAAPAASAIDEAWRSGLAELGLDPAAEAAPDVLVRRLHLDLAGRLPTPAERRAFLDLPATERVAVTVDRLLASDDFAAVATDWLSRWFEVADPVTIDDRQRPSAAALRAELRRIARAGDSLADAVATRLDTPLIERMPDPRDRAELFGRAVLGVRLGCARCHDHPLDRWTREDHLGFAALFVDPRPAADAGMTPGTLFDPATGNAATPRMLSLLDAPDRPVSRPALAAAVAAGPGAFARNVANRVVAELLGRGLVEPVDDHRPTNPPSHPRLLDVLAERFARDDFRLRPLVRLVATSGLYTRTSAPATDPLDAARARYLARRTARPLPEGLLLDAVARALAVPPAPPSARSRSPLARWLALWNGRDLQSVLETDGNVLDVLADLLPNDRARLDSLFEILLSRLPTDEERTALLPMLRAGDDPRHTLRSLAHAIVLGREFTSIR